jgi:NAD-dependent dihydropyrimidine dehydrogenase PreA subunit
LIESVQHVSEAKFGDHNCVVYTSGTDLTHLLGNYFVYGLDNNEFCMWVIPGTMATDDAKVMLRSLLPDTKKQLVDEQVKIVDHNDFYLKSGTFDPETVLEHWQSRMDWAIGNGYSGLRVSGDLGFFEEKDWNKLMDYESRLTTIVGSRKISALCSYPIHKLGPSGLLDIMHHHQIAITKNNGEWHLYEPVGLSLPRDSKVNRIPGSTRHRDKTGSPKPLLYPDRCDGCGFCVEVCQRNVLYLIDKKISIRVSAECDWCTNCEAVCPNDAISCPFEITIVSS